MINRRPLYWGVFLITTGAVVLAGQSAIVTDDLAGQLARLWPLVLVGLGVGLLLRRTRLSLAGGMLAAAMPGLVLGGAVVAGPRMVPDCGSGTPATAVTRSGSFGDRSTVELRLDCGTLDVHTAPGTGWQADLRGASGAIPSVDASGDRLAIRSVEQARWRVSGWGGDVIDVTLPTDTRIDLTAEVNAGRGVLDLAGARLGRLGLAVNAGELRADLSLASLDRLAVDVNAASAWLSLPAGTDLSADLRVNAGALKVCAPADLGIRIHQDATLAATTYAGLARHGETWETPGYALATHHADVTVSVNVGSVDVNPEGGCK
jgi:hypothetical protein